MIPYEFSKLTQLRELFLHNNKLSGLLTLPNAPNLVDLRVNSNYLSGQLPSILYQLKQLKYFVADNNSFSGPLSSQVANLKNLVILSLRGNAFDGAIPAEIKQLKQLEHLRLQRNYFSGSVDIGICNLLSNGKLMDIYTDCKNDLDESSIFYGDGEPEVSCLCCTDCCDPGPEGECMKIVM